MESEFLSKYGDIDNFDEDKMQEDLTIFAVSVAMKEKRLQKEIDNFKNEKSIDVIMEYLQKRKELAEVYTEKIKQTEKEKESNE